MEITCVILKTRPALRKNGRSGWGIMEPPAIPGDAPLAIYLDQAEAYGRSGKFDRAGRALEQARKVNPSWAPKLAGFQGAGLAEPASGYYLLLMLAGRAGDKVFAVHCFRQMMDIRPVLSWDLREAVRNAGIEAEAKEIAREKGYPWQWYE